MTKKPEKHKKFQKQEKDLAQRSGGQMQSGSGNGHWRKGDVRTDEFLIDAKRTDAASWTLHAETWETIRQQALLDGRSPMIALELGGRSFIIVEEGDL